ncbi:uncharacterized protein PG998_015115 [Apiospora kogelbergensis]|uniref:uncharacterized protein n=1 Tax=Apiospora kogelbergensis TaxID=1337665 RepID=UPI00313114C6
MGMHPVVITCFLHSHCHLSGSRCEDPARTSSRAAEKAKKNKEMLAGNVEGGLASLNQTNNKRPHHATHSALPPAVPAAAHDAAHDTQPPGKSPPGTPGTADLAPTGSITVAADSGDTSSAFTSPEDVSTAATFSLLDGRGGGGTSIISSFLARAGFIGMIFGMQDVRGDGDDLGRFD